MARGAPAHVPPSIHLRVVGLLNSLNDEIGAQLRLPLLRSRYPVENTVRLVRSKAGHPIVHTANRMLSRVVDIIEGFVRV